MNLIIKNCIFHYNVLNENKNLVASIKNIHFWSAQKKIVDLKGRTVYTTDIINLKEKDTSKSADENRRYIICEQQNTIATASFKYEVYDCDGSSKRLVLRPPQVEEMDIQMDCEKLNIKRQSDGSFVIRENNSVAGSITSHFPFTKYYISCAGIKSIELLAAIYVLVTYMIDENNFMIV